MQTPDRLFSTLNAFTLYSHSCPALWAHATTPGKREPRYAPYRINRAQGLGDVMCGCDRLYVGRHACVMF